MLKVIIPKESSQAIALYGTDSLHPVDLELLTDLMARMEARIRRVPGVCGLTELAYRLSGDQCPDSSFMVKLASQLEDTTGISITGQYSKATRDTNTFH